MIYLQATIATGTSIDDAATELCDLALRAGVAVQASFQEILLTAHRDSSPVELVAEYGRRRSAEAEAPQLVDSLPFINPTRALQIESTLKVNRIAGLLEVPHPCAGVEVEVALTCKVGQVDYATSWSRVKISSTEAGGPKVEAIEPPVQTTLNGGVFFMAANFTFTPGKGKLLVWINPYCTGSGVGSVLEVDADITVRP